MKFKLTFIAATISVLIFAAEAQRAAIGYPPDGTSITAGSELTVEVDRGNSLSSSTEVAVVIAVLSCPTSGCLPVGDGMGTVLYNGGYDPQYHPEAPFYKPPHQNFTVTIPSTIPKGKAQLGVVHLSLIGALLAPFIETLNVTLNVI
ncbi:hypothetical protein C0995_001156 [Termitomyces sp. Mi166|nr:hypothetical protein C0995_001156 [Termitomyces sp. Mi166\